MEQARIVKIAWARLEGRRPRAAGCNARLGVHGEVVRPAIAQVTTDAGVSGFGAAFLSREDAEALLGATVGEAVDLRDGRLAGGVGARPGPRPFRALEYPLLDLVGRMAGQPVYALLGGTPDADGAFRVPCYDTSLYIDDLHLPDDVASADFIAAEAQAGWDCGHRAFKLKVGRGAMHMDLEAGTRRDIQVIHAVRAAVGPDAPLMIDANNGYNLNLARRVLAETADAGIYWLEEPFHEDGTLYRVLQDWLAAQGLKTLIADGEGDASPRLLDWAREGLIDVVQYDILRPGFSRWLELGPQLDAWGVRSAPHHYGEPFGNYATCHLAPAIAQMERVEWDDAEVPGLDAAGYAIVEGDVVVPDAPGFGLTLDAAVFARAVAERGFEVSV